MIELTEVRVHSQILFVFDIPKTVDAVFERGLAKEPEDRFQSSLQFVDALEAAFEMTQATAPGRLLAIAATIPRSA